MIPHARESGFASLRCESQGEFAGNNLYSAGMIWMWIKLGVRWDGARENATLSIAIVRRVCRTL